MLGKGEMDDNKTCDTRLSIVNTDWNFVLRILATCSGADTLIVTEIIVEKLPCIRFYANLATYFDDQNSPETN